VKTELHEGDGVKVSIEDTGKGIQPSDVERVFQTMFPTKTRGMGVGLSICRSIIEGHNGRICRYSHKADMKTPHKMQSIRRRRGRPTACQ
jgi:signal transduction histidine kinase